MAFRNEDIRYPAWSRVVAGEFANVHPLSMAPAEREAMLDVGVWLVLTVPIWGGVCRRAIDELLNVVARLPEGASIGVRWFDEYEELATWLPDAAQNYTTPQWFTLHNGKLTRQHFGPMQAESIRLFVGE
jgi:hypothetical protein